MLKLSLYGLSGTGKSTVARGMERALRARGLTVEVIKLAAPLYRLQAEIYATAGVDIGLWEHDNYVLRGLADWLRRIRPDCLVEDFLRRVAATTADAIINDDLRDTDVDYPRLAAEGFRFVHVTCDDQTRAGRVQTRGDRTVVPDSNGTWGYDQIVPDWTVDTGSDQPHDLAQQTEDIVAKWLAEPHTP